MGDQKPEERAGWEVENPEILGIVSGPGGAMGPGNKNGAEGMTPGVAIRVGIGVHLPHQVYLERGLLSGLPEGCLLQGFAVIHKATRQGPAERGIFPLYQDNFSPSLSMMISTVGTGFL